MMDLTVLFGKALPSDPLRTASMPLRTKLWILASMVSRSTGSAGRAACRVIVSNKQKTPPGGRESLAARKGVFCLHA